MSSKYALTLALLTLALHVQIGISTNKVKSLELGVYDPCTDPSCDPSLMLRKLKDVGANAILVTLVDGEGYALYPSNLLPVRDEMVDITLRTIKEAKKLGMRVYGWVNIPHEMWLKKHPEWIAVLSNGRPSDFYSSDYFHRIVPPSRIVRERECIDLLRGVAREVAALGVDGIDINDNFQFSDVYLEREDQSLLTSYDEFTVRAFERDTGVTVKGDSPEGWASFIEGNDQIRGKWMEWRAKQVTELIRIITSAARQVRPSIEVRPHLLIWDPLETYGIDFSGIAAVTGTLYVMIPSSESRLRHFKTVWRARQVASKVVASTYLSDLPELSEEEARKRALWIASAGADGIYIFWEGVGEERYGLMRVIFDEFRRAKDYQAPNWLKGARVVSVYTESPDVDISILRDQGVSLVELDVGLSSCDMLYRDFSKALETVKVITREAHSLGMRVVVYVPALEVVCDEPIHKEWAQVSLDGRRLVITGEELDVPWVEGGEFDLWMSPLSPHREILIDRVRKLMEVADGVWLDVPHLPEYLTEEMSGLWPDASDWGKEGFEEEYWVSSPSSTDDPSFPLWLRWRHDMALDFVLAIAEESFSLGKPLLVGSSACDAGATELGFDQVFLRYNPIIVLVPEIGPPTWEAGLSNSSLSEWVHFYAMLKHARGSVRDGVIIPLTYGRDASDSAKQLGLLLPLANGFFETNSNGLMTGSVGVEFRKRAFWLVEMLSGIERSTRNRVGVLFSSFTRDFVDTYIADPYDVEGTIHIRTFREVVRALAEEHIQFDVIPIEMASQSELSQYDVLIAPELRVLSREARSILTSYRGKLLVVGKLGVLDESGGDVKELGVGARIDIESLPTFVRAQAGIPRGILMDGFGDKCEVLSLVNIEGVKGKIGVPRGWVLYFDSLTVKPASDHVDAPDTFLLVFVGDEGGYSKPKRAAITASGVDRFLNADIISKIDVPFTSSGTVIRLGGPAVDPSWLSGEDFEFIQRGGVFVGIRVGNRTYTSSFGDTDYSLIERTKCGNFTFYKVAGVTRYGTRAGLLWLVNKGVSNRLTLLEWKDDGDGTVELSEIKEVVRLGTGG
ncbi:MAG: family 10 glycosylhydrolase [Candidatus Korarchaeota archaeon]|nr:family 10 glycosylhydrolase [Candidatus Korarchaeota archaeon]